MYISQLPYDVTPTFTVLLDLLAEWSSKQWTTRRRFRPL